MSTSKNVKMITGAQAASAKQTAATEPTREDLLKRIAELEKAQKEQGEPAKTFSEMLQFYEEKQRKIKDLATFEGHQAEVKRALTVVSEKVNAGDFETKNYRLSLNVYNEYRDGEKVFSISNPIIIEACAAFILVKINEKTNQLRKEIAQ